MLFAVGKQAKHFPSILSICFFSPSWSLLQLPIHRRNKSDRVGGTILTEIEAPLGERSSELWSPSPLHLSDYTHVSLPVCGLVDSGETVVTFGRGGTRDVTWGVFFVTSFFVLFFYLFVLLFPFLFCMIVFFFSSIAFISVVYCKEM